MDARVNNMIQVIRKRFLPKTRASHPVIGITTALLIRYDVRTQVISSVPAFILPCICGRATLAMEVSTISMKAGIITVSVISHLFLAAVESFILCLISVPCFSSGVSEWTLFNVTGIIRQH
jgi:hypothetical protein